MMYSRNYNIEWSCVYLVFKNEYVEIQKTTDLMIWYVVE